MGGHSQTDTWIGRQIGPYLVRRLLGSGGMGRVYEAEDTALARSLAIKVLRTELAGNARIRARFDREARAASRLNHPHVVAVYDVGTTGDVPYLVMEHLDGPTLAELVATQGPLLPARAGEIAIGILAALEHAHALGVIHRDLKPENVILARRGDGGEQIKVVDFGLADLIDRRDQERRLTEPDRVAGTPEFSSPEQLSGSQVDPRSDLYSVGVVLFEMLTGELPFRAEGATLLAAARLMHPPIAPRELRPGLPVQVEELVLACLQLKPEHRPGAAELAELARGLRAPRRRRRGLLVAAGVLAVALPFALLLAPPRVAPAIPVTAPRSAPVVAPKRETLKVSLLALGAETPAEYEATRNLKKVTAANPGFGVADPSREFRAGDQVAVLVESSSAGWLYVLNQGSDGITRNIEEPKATRVDADTPHMAGPFEIEPPAGTDTMTLLLTRERVAALERDGDLGGVLRDELARRPYGSTLRSEHHAVFFDDAGTGRIVATVPIRHRGE